MFETYGEKPEYTPKERLAICKNVLFTTLCLEGVEIVDASCEQRFSLQEKNAHKGNGEYEDGRTTPIVGIRHGFAHHRSRRNSATYGSFSRSR